ncbi:MAG: phosphotransferase [Actinomycetia bacterium]|nr:phosphotransferase [Actinomycetes bacterium]
MTPSVPSSLAELDAKWISNVLGSHIDDVRVEQLAVGSAFLGLIARLHLTRTDDGPPTVIVKIPPTDEGALTVGRLLNVWHREAMFYELLAPQLPRDVVVPRSYRTVVNPDGYEAAIVIEDMAPAVAGDQIVGATPKAARAAVTTLAGLHAPWWGRPRTEELQWVPGVDRPGVGTGLRSSMESTIDRFVDRYGDQLPTASIEWTRRFIPSVPTWLTSLTQRPMTIAHADYRLENMLFSPDDPSAVTIVDWQTAMYTAGATDLAFFCATSIDTDVRRSIENELVDLYIAGLLDHGVSEAATIDVRADYRTSMLWWMAMLANNLADMETPDERSATLFSTMLERLHAAAIDHRVGDLV